jgi:hypothetical protein
MIKRMAFLLGLLAAPGTPKPPWFISVVRWIASGRGSSSDLSFTRLGPLHGRFDRRAALRMKERAGTYYADQRSYYADQRTAETGVTVTRAPMSISVGVAAGFVRMLLLIAAPIVIAIVARSSPKRTSEAENW